MIEIEILFTFVYFLECIAVQCIKDALSIYFLFRDISGTTFCQGRDISGTTLTLITGSNSRLLRIRFSADLTMYWFPVCHFRCMKFKPLVIWIWNQNIAISTIVGTSSHIIYKIKKNRENNFVCERNLQNFPIHVIRALYIDVSL